MEFLKNKNGILLASLLTSALPINNALASLLIDNLGGDAGYGELAMSANDDGSSNLLNLNFTANFFGNEYANFYINNNGNITFNSPVSSYTPEAFPSSSQPMIAPFWADIDTRGTGAVYVGAANADTTVITWDGVGFYASHTELTNTFQLVLRDMSDTTGVSGDFNIEFRYEELTWTTGDASSGVAGFGGTPAQAGFDAGDNENYFVLPGSFSGEVLELQNTTNVTGGEDGLWVFSIREGTNPGETASNPLMPVLVDNSYTFDFDVEIDERVFIDPEVAIGYDYVLTDSNSPQIASVLLPSGIGDDLYEIWVWDGTQYVLAEDAWGAGNVYTFTNAVDAFRILGIEIDETNFATPLNGDEFVTGLTFVSSGSVSISQTPILFNTTTDVPLPGTLVLLGVGLALTGFARKKTVNS